MTIPNEHNNQDNYDMMMGQAMDPGDHSMDNIPQASIQHDGTQLPTQAASKPPAQTQKPGENANKGMQALQKLKEHMQSGTTKTKGKGK